jgi:hypothetical protein
MKESVKLFLAIAANEEFELKSVDFRAAFLQSKILDRDIYVEPPKYLKKGNQVWKLKKPLYGLDEASRKFWLRVKEIFKKEGLKNVNGDEAFYFCYENDKLQGMVLTHVDDFNISGNKTFVDKIVTVLKRELLVSKIEQNQFRFTTGVDILKTEKGIAISMEEYAKSMEEIEDIRKVKADEKLTKTEIQMYRKYTGKLSWLDSNTHPDLAITALMM